MSKRQSRLAGRDNRTGQFVPVRETQQRPGNTTREHLPLPGYGDVKPKKKG
jgi:hypothetical protein